MTEVPADSFLVVLVLSAPPAIAFILLAAYRWFTEAEKRKNDE
jgi:hypothetical protein